MAKKLPLKSFRLKNFKAIQDSGVVKFTPLTVLIGDNGSGKSSLIEGLETYSVITDYQVNLAMSRWLGFQHIANATLANELNQLKQGTKNIAIEFDVRGNLAGSSFRTKMGVSSDRTTFDTRIDYESVYIGTRKVIDRDSEGSVNILDRSSLLEIPPDISVLPLPRSLRIAYSIRDDEDSSLVLQASDINFNWQFIRLHAGGMGHPRPLERSGWIISLDSDGSNIAEYLLDLRRRDAAAFEGIVETLQHVLPYASYVEPVLTNDLERTVYLQLTEDSYKVPGWLLSTGTLRILCLLALFRHPEPPPLIVIEELENGLDPRTLHLIVDEIQDLVESGRSQVIVTTHSPYLLDLLPLWSIVLVDRANGNPSFSRPSDREELSGWAERFSPGRLYTMGAMNQGNRS